MTRTVDDVLAELRATVRHLTESLRKRNAEIAHLRAALISGDAVNDREIAAAREPVIPTGNLAIENAQINPPKPLGCVVLVDGKSVAVLTLDEVKATAKRIEEFESARRR